MDELHNKAKWYYSYDLYNDNALGLQVEDHVISFDEFKRWTAPILQVPRKGINCPKRPILNIVGYKSQKQFKSSTEDAKRFVRSLIRALQGTMNDGHCFVNFSKSNIVFTHTGEVRFKNIRPVPKNGPAKTLSYLSAKDLVTEFYEGDAPPDIEHLLALMSKHSMESHQQKEALYAVHPSIVPDQEATWMFLKMHEVLKFRMSESQQELVYLKLPYLSDWREIAISNDVLQETYEHPSGGYAKLRGEVTAHKRKVHEASRFLDFIRNGISHRLDRELRVTPSEHHTVITTQYPLLIPMLQEAPFSVLGPKGYALHFNA